MALNSGYRFEEQLGQQASGQTLLGWLCIRYPHSSESEWRARIQTGEVELDGQISASAAVLTNGQTLSWTRPPWQEPDAPLHYQLIYQDDSLLAVIKPSGLPTLPGGGFLDHTLLNLVRRDFPSASPLHRLGRATSGLVLFSRTAQAGALLSKLWREREVEKHYRALSAERAGQDFYEIHSPIGPVYHPRLGTVFAASPQGKASHSRARVLERRAEKTLFPQTLFTVQILTGRPHQIRIHLASIGYPLAGDPLYGSGGGPLPDPGLPGDGGYLLHAETLRFRHPLTGEELELHAPPPGELQEGG